MIGRRTLGCDETRDGQSVFMRFGRLGRDRYCMAWHYIGETVDGYHMDVIVWTIMP